MSKYNSSKPKPPQVIKPTAVNQPAQDKRGGRRGGDNLVQTDASGKGGKR